MKLFNVNLKKKCCQQVQAEGEVFTIVSPTNYLCLCFFSSVDSSLFRSNSWHGLSPNINSRWISSGELSSVLRPFYFAVHPDLFGQHPEQRVKKFNFNLSSSFERFLFVYTENQ